MHIRNAIKNIKLYAIIHSPCFHDKSTCNAGCMTSQPKLNFKYGNKSTRKNMLNGRQECRSWIQLITTVYSVRDDKSCVHDRTNHTGAHTHQREALQNHSPKYKGRCSWCSYSMRHIQRPVVCCLVSWENIVNLEKKSEGV